MLRIRERVNHKDKRGFFNTCLFLLILLSNFSFSAPLKSQRNINTLQNLSQILFKHTTAQPKSVFKPTPLFASFHCSNRIFCPKLSFDIAMFSRIKNKAPVLKRVLRISVFFENFDFNFLKSFFNFLMNFCFSSIFRGLRAIILRLKVSNIHQ